MLKYSVAAIVPCRDEAASIADVIQELTVIGVRQVVIGLDPLSSDATATVAQELGAVVVRSSSSGYDGPCLAALEHLRRSNFDGHVLFLDAGKKYRMDSIGELLRTADLGVDLTFGVRDLQLFWHQKLGNLGFRIALWIRFRHRLQDVSSVRLLPMSSATRLGLKDRKFSLPFQTIVHALLLGNKVAYIPIQCTTARTGNSKVSGSPKNSAKAAIQMARSLITRRRDLPRYSAERSAPQKVLS